MMRFVHLLLLMFGISLFAWGCSSDDTTTTGDSDGGSDGSVLHDSGPKADGTVADTGQDTSTGSDSGHDAGTLDASDAAPQTFTVGGTVTGLAGTGLVLQDNAGDNLAITKDGTFTFAKPVASGAAFAVTVLTQPTAPAQVCTVAGGTGTVTANVTSVAITCATTKYTVGGTVSGLSGTGLVLQDNAGDNLTVTANGGFTFATPVASGAAFNVTVKTQPSGPTQTCSVSGGTGTVGAANVTSVTVNCSSTAFTVGGTVSGLAGSVVLQNNGGNDLTVSTNGTFAFGAPVASGSTYAVTVKTQPGTPSQTCTVSAGTGTVGAANVTGVLVTCVTNKYTVGGTVSGLGGSTVTLKNGSDSLTVSANGTFTFGASVASGVAYGVTVATQPTSPSQTCTVTAGSGTVTNANVTNVVVACSTNKYTVSGSVSGLLGTGLVLEDNGGDDLAISTNGNFTFATSVASGASFAVTVKTQPSGPTQNCNVTGGSGSIGSANVTGVVVNCATDTFTVGGSISGLAGTVVLQNGTDTVIATTNGSFAFSQPVSSGTTYNVVVQTQPGTPSQSCTVTGGSGTVTSANITSVAVTCVTNSFLVGGSVTGLAAGDSVVLGNGSDTAIVSADGTFSFVTAVASGASYAVTVVTQPSSPVQTCTVANGNGTVGGADVTNVAVTCVTNTYFVGGAVSGLAGTGLVLQDNLGDDFAVSGNGPFTFATKVASGAAYAVTVKTQPSSPTQTCSVTGGTGTIGSADVTSVQVSCATNAYTVGGTITGLAGSVTLQNNGGSNLVVTTGTFAFPAANSGTAYNVTVLASPTSPSQTCVVTSGGTGTIGSANVTNVVVTCTTNKFTIGGTITGLTGGASLVLQDNATDNLTRTVSGAFTFATSIASASGYAVTILTQPAGQTCTVANGSGTVAAANVTSVAITCKPNNCKTILNGTPASTDGIYAISVAGVAYNVYCDMTNGGWTEVLYQDIAASPGYPSAAAWQGGLNAASPNVGQYSILPVLSNLKIAASYEFRMDWPGVAGSVTWTQVENPLTSSQTPTISNVVLNPANMVGGCGAFRGLAQSTAGQPTLLHGDSTFNGCFWWAVGETGAWNSGSALGIPSYANAPVGGGAVPKGRLFVR